MTQQQIADALGVSRPIVTMRIGWWRDLVAVARRAVTEGLLDEGHLMALAGVECQTANMRAWLTTEQAQAELVEEVLGKHRGSSAGVKPTVKVVRDASNPRHVSGVSRQGGRCGRESSQTSAAFRAPPRTPHGESAGHGGRGHAAAAGTGGEGAPAGRRRGACRCCPDALRGRLLNYLSNWAGRAFSPMRPASNRSRMGSGDRLIARSAAVFVCPESCCRLATPALLPRPGPGAGGGTGSLLSRSTRSRASRRRRISSVTSSALTPSSACHEGERNHVYSARGCASPPQRRRRPRRREPPS
jgi:hypothetical protein